ncbi:hypothetical protein H0H81_008332 [Sphagnurus paluster]|uniref:C2 domain-containing protein n=1 Tax=Sphagnurus paluster TaxID=117069 RepID=A0A9P7GVY5_9AGAR|nr:hypothetical protein H0H81_008332 [Sphagnurus paluster]
MPAGHRNPLSVSRLVETVHKAKHRNDTVDPLELAQRGDVSFADIEIQFIGASGLPKMDVVGLADPYFVANLDGKISYVSSVKAQTLAPVWNEIWRVKNVPVISDLNVEVFDKDDGRPHDDYIGKFKVSVASGAKEAEIEGPLLRKDRGTFWLKISSQPSDLSLANAYPYLFDGPIRYSRHSSLTVGRLTNLPAADRLYSTWKIYLRGVPLYFKDNYQSWNRDYKAAQGIFGPGPGPLAARGGIQAGHRLLYSRAGRNEFGVLSGGADLVQLLKAPAASGERVKPAVYTYIISATDNSFRFSETGAAFFVDFASKHALHSNCAERVRYSGEFHPRPVDGWANFNESKSDEEVQWELVVDNNSGTYAPKKDLLGALRELLEYNFSGLRIVALDREEPSLKESVQACRKYALGVRGVEAEELEAHAAVGEDILSHRVSVGEHDVSEDTGDHTYYGNVGRTERE